jgi:hypothetical protein
MHQAAGLLLIEVRDQFQAAYRHTLDASTDSCGTIARGSVAAGSMS